MLKQTGEEKEGYITSFKAFGFSKKQNTNVQCVLRHYCVVKGALHKHCCSINSTHYCIFTVFHCVSNIFGVHITLHHKNNTLYGPAYPGNTPSQCIIYTKCVKGCFRSAKCLNNSIHANRERSERSKERMGGGRKLASDPESQIW